MNSLPLGSTTLQEPSMSQARIARPAITPAKMLGGLLLGGALVFAAVQPAQACDGDSCPMRKGEHGESKHSKGHHHPAGQALSPEQRAKASAPTQPASERLHNHMLRRAAPASAPAPASQATPAR
jgi:hypothetical protein